MLKIFRVINFRRFHYPRKFFNNEIFPDYGSSDFKKCANIAKDDLQYLVTPTSKITHAMALKW